MASYGNDAPFGMGECGSARTYAPTDDSKFANMVGRHFYFEDCEYDELGAKPTNSGFVVKATLCRNDSGGALLPGKAVKFSTSDPSSVTGNADTNYQIAGVVDPFLPSVGVQADDVFYVVTGGPVTAKLTPDGTSGIAAGGRVVVLGASAGTLSPAPAVADDKAATAVSSVLGTIGWAAFGAISKTATEGRIFIGMQPPPLG